MFGENEDFFTLKGLTQTVADTLFIEFTYEADHKPFLHPYQTATILCDGEAVGYLGKLAYEIQDELDMRVPAYVAEINLKALTKYYGKSPVYQPLPKFAVENRDLALVMDKEITCAQVERVIFETCDYITSVKLFDVYEGVQLPPKKKSMAFTVVFTPKDEEFKAEMIDGFVSDILKNLGEKYGVVLRA